MELQIGVSKINKYATSESGDTLEVVERPHGGVSIVLADGQRSGKSAKRISNMVVRKVTALLAEGVRDGAAARAASDYLFSERGGKVQSTLNIITIDLDSNTFVITRNNPIPILLGRNFDVELLDEESKPVGIYKNTRPVITELGLEDGISIAAFSDGLIHAGDRKGEKIDTASTFIELLSKNFGAQEIADSFMNLALDLDDNRPIDDISILIIRVMKTQTDNVRRMTVQVPL